MKLTKKLTTVLLLLFTVALFAQDFQGVATYKSHRKVDLNMGDEDENSEMRKQVAEQLRKQFQQEYTLKFNRHESIYKQNEKLDAPQPAQSGFQVRIATSSNIMYKNIKENRYTNKTEMFGKLFLIKDSLNSRAWKLENETKNIGKYTCFKATFTDEYETQTLNEKGELTEETKERTTTVWYTPQIPVNNGPADFHGLPGLILEVNDGQLTLVCSKIVMNPEEVVEIEEPTKGKEVTQAKYDEIQEKKSKEMMEQFQSRRGDGDGERVMIRIGG